MRLRVINDFNLKRQAEELGVKIWQTPGFLFIVMGIVAVIIMTATYFISKNYDNPQIVIVSECLVVVIVLIVGTSLTHSIEQMAIANRMRSEFVSVASHQLRTPLSAIRWEIELILNKLSDGLSDKQKQKLETISELSHRMTRLVNDLLDVARIEQNRMILRKQSFDMAEAVREIIKEMVPPDNARHITVEENIADNLPKVLGDEEKIKLVLDNLISNAFKYTTSGGKIEVDLFQKDNNLVCEIKDNGVGIPEEQLDRVFEKFFRSDNAIKYQTEGAGLGLYISKNILEQLDGKIWFQSIENVGSKFSFSLPIESRKTAAVK